MKRKAAKRVRRRWQAALDEWIPALGLDEYHIEVAYYSDPDDFPAGKGDDTGRPAAQVISKWQYMGAWLGVNMLEVADLDDVQLEEAVVHELCHVLVDELDPQDVKHEERVVTQLSKAFIRTRNLARKAAQQ